MNKDDLVASAAAKSDQIDADNLIGGITMDVTIKAVQRGPSQEQPLQLVLEETSKFYRPSKTFRRALIGCFGDEPGAWIGQRIRLVRNPDTMFGGVKVGGIEVSHASIAAPIVLMLSTKRGKKSEVKINVLPKKASTPKPVSSKDVAKAGIEQAKAAITPAQTITGDPSEGDLSEGMPLPASPEDVAKVITAFDGIGYDKASVEAEMEKTTDAWVIEDIAKARTLFNQCKALQTQQEPQQEI
jgi:hypothetical protein